MPYLPGDARSFTTWGTSCMTDTYLKNKEHITSEYEYRRYLQKNATKLIQTGSEMAYKGQLESPICKHCGKIVSK